MAGPRIEGGYENGEIPINSPEIDAWWSFNDLTQWLRNIPLLNENIKGFRPYRASEIRHEQILVNETLPCAMYVLNQRLRIQRELRRRILQKYGIDTLNLPKDKSFLKINWAGNDHFLFPPIVEVSEDDGGAKIIADGLHRFITAIEDREEKMTVVLIKGSASPLPILPVTWQEIKHRDQVPPLTQKRKQRFNNARDAVLWRAKNLDRFLTGFSEEDLKDFGYHRYFKDFAQFPPIAQSKVN